MNKSTLEQITAEASRVADAAWARLDGRVTDPEALRDVVAALDEVRDALLLAGETATLQECGELGAMYRATAELQAKVLLRIHEVELILTANARVESARATLH